MQNESPKVLTYMSGRPITTSPIKPKRPDQIFGIPEPGYYYHHRLYSQTQLWEILEITEGGDKCKAIIHDEVYATQLPVYKSLSDTGCIPYDSGYWNVVNWLTKCLAYNE